MIFLETKDENDNLVYEYWNDNKKLTIFIENDKMTYLKSWGKSIINEMEDGEVNSILQLLDLWIWLYDELFKVL